MRASKEACDKASEQFDFVVAMLDDKIGEGHRGPKTEKCIEGVREFLNAAKRRLPTEAAYARDRKRRAQHS